MAFEIESPESMDTGGAFLQEPGTYHVAVLNVDEQPQSKGGQLLDGFRVDFEVLAGPQHKKQAEVTFWNPKLTDKNAGEMAKKKQSRFAVFSGIMQPAKPGEKVTVDLQQAKGRQLIVTFSKRKGSEGDKEFIDLNFADIWHVDDPAAPQCERNQDALKLLPASLRRKPESFKPAQASGSGTSNGNGASNANGNGSTKATAQQPAAAAVNLDDV